MLSYARHHTWSIVTHVSLALLVHITIPCLQNQTIPTLVDLPGLMDAPANYASSGLPVNNGPNHANQFTNNNSRSREYDFAGVVKWYADRADVVLLFFDPDKPGTTGETLSTTMAYVSSSIISRYYRSNASSESMSDGGSISIHPMILTDRIWVLVDADNSNSLRCDSSYQPVND